MGASRIPVKKHPEMPNKKVAMQSARYSKKAADIIPVAMPNTKREKPTHRTVDLTKLDSKKLSDTLKLCHKDLESEFKRSGAEGVRDLWKRIRYGAKISLVRFPISTSVTKMIWDWQY